MHVDVPKTKTNSWASTTQYDRAMRFFSPTGEVFVSMVCVALQVACSSRSACHPCGKVEWRAEIATYFTSYPCANVISCTLNLLVFGRGGGWGVLGEGDVPFLGLGENGAVPLVADIAKNTENRKFCKEGVRASAETFKNEPPPKKGGVPGTSQRANLLLAHR